MDGTDADVLDDKAGIDLRLRAVLAEDWARIGAMDRRCFIIRRLVVPPENGSLSSSSEGGGGETSRSVLGRSSSEIVECRRATPTVDVGEGGSSTTSILSTGGARGSGWEGWTWADGAEDVECERERRWMDARRVISANALMEEDRDDLDLDAPEPSSVRVRQLRL